MHDAADDEELPDLPPGGMVIDDTEIERGATITVDELMREVQKLANEDPAVAEKLKKR